MYSYPFQLMEYTSINESILPNTPELTIAVNKKLSDQPITCAHCREKSFLYLICEGGFTYTYVHSGEEESVAHANWQVLVCPNCAGTNIIQRFHDYEADVLIGFDHRGEEVYEESITINQIFPMRNIDLPLPNQNMPEPVKDLYEEAMDVFGVSPRSASALLRLAIQTLCIELGERGKSLNADIGNLVRKGLPAHIQQALDIVRVIGNESVHPGELNIKDDPDIARSLFNLINEIVEDRIGLPLKRTLIEETYDSLPSTKREGIELRDKPGRVKS